MLERMSCMPKKMPVYIQMHNQMREWINSREWEEGRKIPSERDLALQFDVSRMTARQAVNTLVDEGLLERRRGAGTFVALEKVREKMSGVPSFTETVERQGKSPASKLVAFHTKPASISEAEKLMIEHNEEVLIMERIRTADGIPICYEVATIPFKFVEDLSKTQITQHLFKTLEMEKEMRVERSEQTISATWASESIAEMLGIKRGSSVLRLRQVSYSQEGTPFEYVRSQYVGDRYEFFLEATKK